MYSLAIFKTQLISYGSMDVLNNRFIKLDKIHFLRNLLHYLRTRYERYRQNIGVATGYANRILHKITQNSTHR